MGKSLAFSGPNIITYKMRTALCNPHLEVQVKLAKTLMTLGMALKAFDF